MPTPPPPQPSPQPSPAFSSPDEEGEEVEDSGEEPEESEASGQSGASNLPANDSNPLNPAGNSLDQLIQQRINADLWEEMKGGLPCLDSSVECVRQLQELAVSNNTTIKNIDTSVEEINTKIEEARRANKKAVQLSIFKPLVQAYLKLETVTPTATPDNPNPKPRQRGLIQRIFSIFTSPVNVVNEVLSLIGIPLLEGVTSTNAEAQRNAIAISDLQVKSAELQKGRAEIAEKLKETIALQVLEFDAAAKEFQLSQEVAKRDVQRLQLVLVEYRLGQGTSENYLSQLSALDQKKAQALRAWTTMRSRMERIKLLVLAPEE